MSNLNTSSSLDSTYSVVKSIYRGMGGAQDDFDSTYDITLAILDKVESGSIGGSTVEVSSSLTEGTKIATITVDDVATDLYAPAGGGASSPFISGTGSGSAILSGSGATASGQFAVAQGTGSIASGVHSHAEGSNTNASGWASHAEGDYAKASGGRSHAEGYFTNASGQCSHAEGHSTLASGILSHAEGEGTTAKGQYSHAEGRYTSASNDHEHAQGKFNATASGQIFSIGVGNFSIRTNAISVITGSNPSASVYVYGIGGYDGTNPTAGTNDLATYIASLEARIAALES